MNVVRCTHSFPFSSRQSSWLPLPLPLSDSFIFSCAIALWGVFFRFIFFMRSRFVCVSMFVSLNSCYLFPICMRTKCTLGLFLYAVRARTHIAHNDSTMYSRRYVLVSGFCSIVAGNFAPCALRIAIVRAPKGTANYSMSPPSIPFIIIACMDWMERKYRMALPSDTHAHAHSARIYAFCDAVRKSGITTCSAPDWKIRIGIGWICKQKQWALRK